MSAFALDDGTVYHTYSCYARGCLVRSNGACRLTEPMRNPREQRRNTMAEIRHRVGIQAPAERVYGALTTAAGIRRTEAAPGRRDGESVPNLPSPRQLG